MIEYDVLGAIDYDKLKRKISHALGYKVVDVISNSYLRIMFDSPAPAGVTAEASIDSPEPGKKYIILHYVELQNDTEAVGDFYLVNADGAEMPLITNTSPGRTYIVDVYEAIGVIPSSRLILRAKTITTTTKWNTVEARYSGRVVALTL